LTAGKPLSPELGVDYFFLWTRKVSILLSLLGEMTAGKPLSPEPGVD